MNILLVEDELRVANFIQRGLRAEGWSTTHVSNGEKALGMLESEEFDVVVLDLMLPGISGQDTCRKMRARDNFTPVLMLTALDASDELVKGLTIGADDYLTKPFDFDELVARITALHRRNLKYSDIAAEPIIRIGKLSFNTQSLTVVADNKILELTAKEREILRLLMSNPSKVFSRERILSTVWGVNEDPLTNIVDVYIARLRKKLGSCETYILTIRGVGYRIDDV